MSYYTVLSNFQFFSKYFHATEKNVQKNLTQNRMVNTLPINNSFKLIFIKLSSNFLSNGFRELNGGQFVSSSRSGQSGYLSHTFLGSMHSPVEQTNALESHFSSQFGRLHSVTDEFL